MSAMHAFFLRLAVTSLRKRRNRGCFYGPPYMSLCSRTVYQEVVVPFLLYFQLYDRIVVKRLTGWISLQRLRVGFWVNQHFREPQHILWQRGNDSCVLEYALLNDDAVRRMKIKSNIVFFSHFILFILKTNTSRNRLWKASSEFDKQCLGNFITGENSKKNSTCNIRSKQEMTTVISQMNRKQLNEPRTNMH